MTSNLLNTQAAADWLNEAVPGESPAYWWGVLINNRRTDRPQVHKVAFVRIGKAAFYGCDALQDFAEFEKCRRLGSLKLTGRSAKVMQAFGIGQGGTTHGRIWAGAEVVVALDPAGQVFLQLIVRDPLTVFRMTPEQAEALGDELATACAAAKRYAK